MGRYEILDTEERTKYSCRQKMFPRALTGSDKRKLRAQYEAKLGHFIIGDGFLVSTHKHEEATLRFEHAGYHVDLRNRGHFLQFDQDITDDESPEKCMQILVYGLHKLAESAGYKKDSFQGKTVLWKHSDTNKTIVQQRGANWSAPDVWLFRVFEAKLNVGYDRRNDKKQLFVFADVRHKHLAAKTLRELIEDMKDRHPRQEDFQRAVEDAFLRKRALVSYSSNWVKIREFDWTSDENFEFDARGKKTTIKEYCENKDISVRSRACCTIMCDVEGRRRGDTRHLPQHLYVTVSKERTKDVDSQIKDREAMEPRDRQRAVNDFMRDFSEVFDPSFPLQVDSKPFMVKAHIFPEIKLEMNLREPTALPPRDFSQSWGRVDGFLKGKSDNEPHAINILILGCDRRTVGEAQHKAQGYVRKRRCDRHIKSIEQQSMRSWNEDEVRDILEEFRGVDIIIGIISSGKEGSQEKQILARASGTIITQCITDRNVNGSRQAAFLGMMDDVMAKAGFVWYGIDYGLRSIKTRDIWVIGIDSYAAQSESHCSGLAIEININIEAGTLTNFVRGNLPLYPREVICPMDSFRQGMVKLFKEALDKAGRAPQYILLFRGGASQGEIDIVRTNELVGCMKALYEAFPKPAPKLSYFLVPRGSSIRFKNRSAVCISDTIAGGYYLNFYTQVNNIARKTPRIIQYICLHDEGLYSRLVKEEPEDWLKLLNGLCYLYPQSISFRNGPCSYPGPLKAAQNHAENFTQAIFKNDRKLADLDELPNSLTSRLATMQIDDMTDDRFEPENPQEQIEYV